MTHFAKPPSNWIHDVAVEIGDQWDTPDFQTDPDGNRDTIRHVEGILMRRIAEDLPLTFSKFSGGVYDIMLAGCVVGRVYYLSGHGHNKNKGWMISQIGGRYHKTRAEALQEFRRHYGIKEPS